MNATVTVLTHTRDSAATLPKLLETTRWADERIIVDMRSTDATLELARAAGCRIMETAREDVVDSVRNRFLAEATSDWTFVIDSDEYLSDDAEACVRDLIREHGGTVDAFEIPRYNSIAGHVMRGTAFYPDHQIRLFRTGSVTWQDGHHQRPVVHGGESRSMVIPETQNLHIHHVNYDDVSSFIARQMQYALTDAYDDDPETFDFNDYVTQAYAAFEQRFDEKADGDLSVALATIIAWDRIMRGLVHWDRLGRKPSLDGAFSLPVRTFVEIERRSMLPLRVARRAARKVAAAARLLVHTMRSN